MLGAQQRSFDDLGAPLEDTTFCVVDLETTGGSPDTCGITEIGAVKVRGGVVLGEFQTLVDPGEPIPTFVRLLTGISDEMVSGAPPIEAVLPAFLEFLGDAVIVAHNASFDTRFLQAAAAASRYPRLENAVVCTVRLARRLVRDEVPNLRLATLAAALRSATQPSHRALADARAACDVFHALLELAGRWGVLHLDDLLWFQGASGHPQYRKVRLADDLPRARGVYLFVGGAGEVLYVGKATDLRSRVRSYFSDERRRIGDLLRAVERIDHATCASDLEASVVEARLIRRHSPAFNRIGRGRARSVFLSLTRERYPRLSVSRDARAGDGSRKPAPGRLGPIPSAAADTIRRALEEAGGVRTCTERIGAKTRFPACVLGQIGRCAAPCEARTTPEEYAARLAPVRAALDGDPTVALEALAARMDRLAGDGRFEEAAAARDRIGALVAAAAQARAVGALVDAGMLRIAADGSVLEIRDGALASVDGRPPGAPPDGHPDEPRLITAWLWRNRRRVRLLEAAAPFALAVPGGWALEDWRRRLAGAARADRHAASRNGRQAGAAPRRRRGAAAADGGEAGDGGGAPRRDPRMTVATRAG